MTFAKEKQHFYIHSEEAGVSTQLREAVKAASHPAKHYSAGESINGIMSAPCS